jgi:hypothetical protein
MNGILFFAGLMAWPFRRKNELDMTQREMFLMKLALLVDVILMLTFALSGLPRRLFFDLLIALGLA